MSQKRATIFLLFSYSSLVVLMSVPPAQARLRALQDEEDARRAAVRTCRTSRGLAQRPVQLGPTAGLPQAMHSRTSATRSDCLICMILLCDCLIRGSHETPPMPCILERPHALKAPARALSMHSTRSLGPRTALIVPARRPVLRPGPSPYLPPARSFPPEQLQPFEPEDRCAFNPK